MNALAVELGRPAGERHAALLEAVDPVRHLQRLHDVLLYQDHAGALLLDPRQRGVDAADDDGGEPKADLVAQEHARVGHERAPDGRHLLLAARQRLRRRLAPLDEHRKQVVDALERPIAGLAPAVGADPQVLLDAERREQAPPLRHQGDAEPHDLGRRQAADRPAVEHDAAGLCRQEAGDGLEEGRLAGAVGADDGERLARVELEVDAVEGLEVAVEGGEPMGLKQGHRCASRGDAGVDLAHLGRRHHGGRVAFRDLAAEVEHDQAVDHGQQRMHDVLDPHDGGAAGADALDGADQLLTFALREAAGDLVEQQHLRPGGKRTRHLQPLALQEREGARQRIGARHQVGLFQNAGAEIDAVVGLASAAVHGGHEQVLEHGEALERPRDLMRAADAGPAALMRARARHVDAVEQHLSAIGRDVAGDQVEQGRLAGAVGSDDAHRVAARNRQIYAVGRLERAERLGEATDLEQHRQVAPRRRRLGRASAKTRHIGGPGRVGSAPGFRRGRPNLTRLGDRLHLAADRDGGRRPVVGDDDIVAVAVLDAPLAADQRCLGHILGGERRQSGAVPLHLPHNRIEVGCGDRLHRRSGIADLGGALENVVATSNSEWMKPMGCVHCFLVAAS